jgi:hypothetical protein
MKFMQTTTRSLFLTSVLVMFTWGADSVRAVSVFIDFGNTTADTGTDSLGRVWNNWTYASTQAAAFVPNPLLNLVDSTNVATGIDIYSSSVSYQALDGIGTQVSTLFPASATKDGWVINGTSQTFFTVLNLDVTKTYDFTFYGSRLTNDGSTRISQYDVTGAEFGLASLNVVNNVDGVAMVAAIHPLSDGSITIGWSINPSSSPAFGYINVMQISYAIPEPSSLALASVGVGLLAWGLRRRLRSAL